MRAGRSNFSLDRLKFSLLKIKPRSFLWLYRAKLPARRKRPQPRKGNFCKAKEFGALSGRKNFFSLIGFLGSFIVI